MTIGDWMPQPAGGSHSSYHARPGIRNATAGDPALALRAGPRGGYLTLIDSQALRTSSFVMPPDEVASLRGVMVPEHTSCFDPNFWM